MTTKSLPRNFFRVLTLVGDSTMRRDLFPVIRVDLDLALDLALDLTFTLTLGIATVSPN
jgi:hypothetical protein|tara:strand:- start:146 stop:322 length:177 start_codon:yes stop_codon:yes gene_type:complete